MAKKWLILAIVCALFAVVLLLVIPVDAKVEVAPTPSKDEVSSVDNDEFVITNTGNNRSDISDTQVQYPLFRTKVGNVEFSYYPGYLVISVYQNGELVEGWDIFAPNEYHRGFCTFYTRFGEEIHIQRFHEC